ncbi:MAG: hypothetical protein HY905_09915 [Deltaproteobacteria bacterium]|nr:hypothetical protein [Deltaproteobacteria bacterium]
MASTWGLAGGLCCFLVVHACMPTAPTSDDAADGRGADDVSDADDGGREIPPGPCPTSPNPEVPEMRIRFVRFSKPEVLANPVLAQWYLDDALSDSTIWLLRFAGLGSGTVTVRFGAGAKARPWSACTYSFIESVFPSGNLGIAESGLEFTAVGYAIPELDLPIWQERTAFPDPISALLPLREVTIAGTFSVDHLNIGAYDESARDWVDVGEISARIRVADARDVVVFLDIFEGECSLCGLLSGDIGSGDDAAADDCLTDPSTWPQQPDTVVDAEPAWSVAATFVAEAAWIGEDY